MFVEFKKCSTRKLEESKDVFTHNTEKWNIDKGNKPATETWCCTKPWKKVRSYSGRLRADDYYLQTDFPDCFVKIRCTLYF